MNRSSHRTALPCTGIGDGFGVKRADVYRIGLAIGEPVIDGELRHVRSGRVECQLWCGRGGIEKTRATTIGFAEEAPAIRERIAVDVMRASPIQYDNLVNVRTLVTPGIR